ncbi:unnamed protein product, partial [Echinostoma caproni]|uniref:Reverse transcriptase domain-containing protein n=1 Tax=Echinostoma caproni TaxID=27848 RepID=A0A183BE97_9TREM
MFFESGFNLQHARTFSQVIPLHPRSSGPNSLTTVSFAKSFVDPDTEGPQSTATDKQEQDFRAQHDRLTQYLDIVEVHLAEQIEQGKLVIQFKFNEQINRQKDGVAMGSPLGPLFA